METLLARLPAQQKARLVSLQTDDLAIAIDPRSPNKNHAELNQGHLLSGLMGRFIDYKVKQMNTPF